MSAVDDLEEQQESVAILVNEFVHSPVLAYLEGGKLRIVDNIEVDDLFTIEVSPEGMFWIEPPDGHEFFHLEVLKRENALDDVVIFARAFARDYDQLYSEKTGLPNASAGQNA